MDETLTRDILTDILRRYRIGGKITQYAHMIGHDSGDGRIKYVTRVDTDDGRSYICKVSREPDKFKRSIEDQCIFSEYLRERGIKTPRRYRVGNRYRIDCRVGSYIASVTLEDYIGEEVRQMTPELSYRLGKLVAEMHALSESGRCHIHRGETIFNLVGYNEVNGYDTLCRLDREGKLPHDIFLRIRRAYRRIYRKMESIYPSLPIYAVQGDISINNLTLSDGKLGIFDYNIAGDIALVSDMLLNGLLNAYEMDYPDSVTADEIYSAYENGYFTVRSFSDSEREIYEIAYPMSRALWFSFISGTPDSISALIDADRGDEANKKLADIACELENIKF